MKCYVCVFLFCFVLTFNESTAYIEAVGAVGNMYDDQQELQVAFACNQGGEFHGQYMDDDGKWVSDLENSIGCLEHREAILDYCKRIYPHSDINNIVESTHIFTINNWCKIGRGKCSQTFSVRPFRCLSGTFQSDALLVPEPCQFDHTHNNSQCTDFFSWNKTASASCVERDLVLRSFAMLLPCGTDMFTGVEFVCCPSSSESEATTTTTPTVSTATPTSTVSKFAHSGSDRDPYFLHFDARTEFESFQDARRRLDKREKQKMSDIMSEWNLLEDNYEKIRGKDAVRADKYKQRMTARFQRMVNALKQEVSSEKKQLVAMHQQRITEHINERKKAGMMCLVEALNTDPPSQRSVHRCLDHLLRALYKDRHHTIAHYDHLSFSDPERARAELSATIDHLKELERMVTSSVQLLDRYPTIRNAIRDDVDKLIEQLRRRDTVPIDLASTIVSTTTPETSTTQDETTSVLENLVRQQTVINAERVATKQKIARIYHNKEAMRNGDDLDEGGELLSSHLPPSHHFQQPQASPSYQPLSQLRRSVSQHWAASTGAALLLISALIGTVFMLRQKRRIARLKRCGFIPVAQHLGTQSHTDAMTPEEKHVAQMRVNGYENPTYKYFESK